MFDFKTSANVKKYDYQYKAFDKKIFIKKIACVSKKSVNCECGNKNEVSAQNSLKQWKI